MIGDSLIGTSVVEEPVEPDEALITNFNFTLADLTQEALTAPLQQRAEDAIPRMQLAYYSSDTTQVIV